MNFAFHHPILLIALPLALLPLLGYRSNRHAYPWLKMMPPDPLSNVIDTLVRLLGVLAIASLLISLAGLHLKEQPFQRVSRGAETVILMDRSRSMDQRLVPRKSSLNWLSTQHERKGDIAKRLLSEFVTARAQDRLAFVLFSTRTMEISGFTREHGMIQAAIAASQSGRGISDTELGQAVVHSLEMFKRRPLVGPRALILVSDGGARLDANTKARLTELLDQTRVGVYWIYLRSLKSPGLLADQDLTVAEAETVPEHLLHKFFQTAATFYRAYEAESPDSMREAIQDISKLEDRPIRHLETRPVQNLDRYSLSAALTALALLLLTLLILTRSTGGRQ